MGQSRTTTAEFDNQHLVGQGEEFLLQQLGWRIDYGWVRCSGEATIDDRGPGGLRSRLGSIGTDLRRILCHRGTRRPDPVHVDERDGKTDQHRLEESLVHQGLSPQRPSVRRSARFSGKGVLLNLLIVSSTG